ncbi:MAG: hypothetical protein ACYC21_13450 [Eubacteriales bacterium]
MQVFRRLIQLSFLGIFTVLMVVGKAQYWMAFIFASILLSTFVPGEPSLALQPGLAD